MSLKSLSKRQNIYGHKYKKVNHISYYKIKGSL